MKRLVLILALSVFGISSFAQGNMMFENANQLYHNGAYNQAINLYSNLIENGYCSPELYYNIGNAYFKTNQTGQAIWAYKMSLNLERRAHTQENYLIAKSKVKKPLVKQQPIFFVRWWKALYSALTVSQWGLLSLMAYLFGIGVLIINRMKPLSYKWMKWSKTAFVIGAVAFLLMGWTYYYQARKCEAVFVHSSSVSKRLEGQSSLAVAEGIEVEILSKNSFEGRPRYQVRLPNGAIAWAKTQDIRLLD